MGRVVNARTIEGLPLAFQVLDGKFFQVRVDSESPVLFNPSSLQHLSAAADVNNTDAVIDAQGAILVPAALDIHVHSRDPGLTHKEDWHSLAKGAFAGGVVAVADMPNTLPPTMTRDAVLTKAARAAASGLDFRLLLGVGANNIDQVAGLLADKSLPVCALKVFYGKTTGELVYDDLETLARSLPEDGAKPIVFHSEDQCIVDCNEQRLAPLLRKRDNKAFLAHSDIRSSEAAMRSTRAILDWASESYKRPIHIAHISTPVEIELIQAARAKGARVTSEVAPHHLLLSTSDYERLGPLAKMNPPLRSPEEVQSLVRLVGQGAVDIFATDHAPHLLQEKRTDVGHSPSGVPGVEFFYPLLFKVQELSGLSLSRAVAMATEVPAQLFGFAGKGRIADGYDADFVWLGTAAVIDDRSVRSKCGWTPYAGMPVPRSVQGTWLRGRQVFSSAKDGK